MQKFIQLIVAFALFVGVAATVSAQVTNASFSGIVKDESGLGLPGAIVTATHVPSGSQYQVATREDGRFNLPNVRSGGPYTVSVSSMGYNVKEEGNINLSLGQEFRLVVDLQPESVEIGEVEIVSERGGLIDADRTGAATNIKKDVINGMPTISRSLNDLLRLTPQSRSSSVASTTGSGTSFAGQDSRFNNLMIDGSVFNNSFGLSSAPAGQTNSTPISLDAIEEIQVNLAPYDVRQGGFTGAGVNAITRSGTNQFQGSVFYNTRNESYTGTQAGESEITKNDFNVNQFGFRFGGPIIKNKLFFFVNGEAERRSDPATTFRALRPGVNDGLDNTSRVLASDLETLRTFLSDNFGYDAGEFEDYNLETYSNKALVRLDYNLDSRQRLSLRYNFLRSYRDVLTSNSGTFSGGRVGTVNALNFQSSKYIINNDIHSVIGEYNFLVNNSLSINFIGGFTSNRDYRDSRGGIFPQVDILENGITYTSFGYEPFTPNNRLNTDTWQGQLNVTKYLGAHTITAGLNFESFKFENTFTPFYYGQFIYNSLADFYAAAQGDTSINPRRYQLTYSALEGGALPTAVTQVSQPGIYIQDQFYASERLKITAGIRADLQTYKQTALENEEVNTFTFVDELGDSVKYNTGELPEPTVLFSPRLGFNYDVMGDKKLQVRGGTGLFSGRPAYVWISNQVGNNGILTGSTFIQQGNNTPNATQAYDFSPNVEQYIPENATTPSSYNIAIVDPNFKYPQVWRSDLGVDYQLPFNLVGTLEGLYTKTINNVFYIDANVADTVGAFSGPDNRPYYPGGNANRINSKITNAIILKNTNEGYSYSLTAKLERAFRNGLYLMAAYNFAESKDLITAGSIAESSYRDNRSVNGNNFATLAYSDFDQRNRFILAASYRKEYAKYFASQLSIFFQTGNQGRFSYVYNGNPNNDQYASNDLLFVPNDAADLNFEEFTYSYTDEDGNQQSTVFTAQNQIDAFNAFIDNDDYLSSIRGEYSERNGRILPWISTLDLTFMQEFILKVNGSNHRLQLRADIYNFGNLINNNWGVSNAIFNNQPLQYRSRNADNEPVYRMAVDNSTRELLLDAVKPSVTLNDVWQIQLGARYIFN